MKLDLNGINKKVKPFLTSGNKELESAVDKLSAIKVPSDFCYISNINKLPRKNKRYRKRY